MGVLVPARGPLRPPGSLHQRPGLSRLPDSWGRVVPSVWSDPGLRDTDHPPVTCLLPVRLSVYPQPPPPHLSVSPGPAPSGVGGWTLCPMEQLRFTPSGLWPWAFSHQTSPSQGVPPRSSPLFPVPVGGGGEPPAPTYPAL
ncbi:hypothetical protein KIL84_004963 [Mauremys mutica]|uniref:Uncharacterized protein n=1 Tax=Mauremys mutica TaxID=74926 RepID=A0A9D3WNY4_9SAUR|nr:hypothetical protein KIL84_004963 [Mauremys mutica]